MRVLTPAEARDLDARTIGSGTAGLTLMKRAASHVAREVRRATVRRPLLSWRVVVLAGTGNNGGDGFETARRLIEGGGFPSVETLLLGRADELSGDAAAMYRRLTAIGGKVREVHEEAGLEPLRSATLVVDALFGTGLSRPLSGLAARAAQLASSGRTFVVAVDIPSGLFGGEGSLPGPHVVADVTVTFGAPKRVHALLPAAGVCGRIVVADIGLVREVTAAGRDALEAVTAADVAPLFPRRDAAAHKGTFGRLAIVGGSEGMAGAPALAARAAHRSGAGLVTVSAPENVRLVVHALWPDATTAPEDADLSGFDALAVGPGLGTSEASRSRLSRAVSLAVPAVFDADALNLAAGHPELFARREAPTVLTPHPGEAARLLGIEAARINEDRLGAASELARRARGAVVLKGFRSVVAGPAGERAVVLAGNPGMAKGGAGDVLTGVVGAFLARGLSPFDAARAAAWLHGTAGDLAREGLGEESVAASDLVEHLSEAFLLVRETAFA